MKKGENKRKKKKTGIYIKTPEILWNGIRENERKGENARDFKRK